MHVDRAHRHALTGVLALVILLSSAAATDGQELRMLIASGVACRAQPGEDAPVQRRYSVGDVFAVGGRTDAGGATWYAAGRGCWLYGPLTVPYERRDPTPALLAAADHILAREDSPLFVEWVAVENLLLRNQTTADRAAAPRALPPLLQLRRLQVVERALRSREASRYAVARDPMTEAWMVAHGDLIRPFEPSGGWVMEAETYWELYERHRESDVAEEIAWAAATGHVPSDECYASCILGRVRRTHGRYWQERPAGAHVAEALARSADAAEWAVRYGCQDWEREGARSLARELLSSLEPITAPGKAPLVRHLEAVERACQ